MGGGDWRSEASKAGRVAGAKESTDGCGSLGDCGGVRQAGVLQDCCKCRLKMFDKKENVLAWEELLQALHEARGETSACAPAHTI